MKNKLKVRRMPGGGYETNILFCLLNRNEKPDGEYAPVCIEPDEDYPRKWCLSGIGNMETKREAIIWLKKIIEYIEITGSFRWARPGSEIYDFIIETKIKTDGK